MPTQDTVAIVDSDTNRRNRLTKILLDSRRHAEPFESVPEFLGVELQPDLVLAHAGDSTFDKVLEAQHETGQWAPVIAYSAEPTPDQIVDAMVKGAADYLAWPIEKEALAARLNKVGSRISAFAETRRKAILARQRIERLSRRELEVLRRVADGQSNRAIAENLEISPRTVEIHRANMMAKLDAHHPADVVRIAIDGALVS